MDGVEGARFFHEPAPWGATTGSRLVAQVGLCSLYYLSLSASYPSVSRVRCGGLGFVSVILAFLNRPQRASTAFFQLLNSVPGVVF